MRRNEDGLRFRRRKYPKIQEIFKKFDFQARGSAKSLALRRLHRDNINTRG